MLPVGFAVALFREPPARKQDSTARSGSSHEVSHPFSVRRPASRPAPVSNPSEDVPTAIAGSMENVSEDPTLPRPVSEDPHLVNPRPEGPVLDGSRPEGLSPQDAPSEDATTWDSSPEGDSSEDLYPVPPECLPSLAFLRPSRA